MQQFQFRQKQSPKVLISGAWYRLQTFVRGHVQTLMTLVIMILAIDLEVILGAYRVGNL